MAEKAASRILFHRLCEAIDNNDIENVRMCIQKRVGLNKMCYYSERYHKVMYPLALACCRGHEEIMEELIKAGANPNRVDRSLPAMFIAAKQCVLTLSTLRCLISHGGDVDFTVDFCRDGHCGGTILHYLARGQFSGTRDELLSAVKLVLDNGANVDARDGCGYTPLYQACRSGRGDLVNLFIAEGADVNFNIGYRTLVALSTAADRCDIDMFDSLLNAGANRHINCDVLVNPCRQNNHAMITRILDTCVMDINMSLSRYTGVQSILQYACRRRYITSETVRLLLDRGADVRAVTDTGNTALHYAAEVCDCNKIRQLLSYNLPLNIKNNKNQTPLVTIIEPIIAAYEDTEDQRDYATHVYQAGLAFKMLVTAGAKVTADVEHNLNQFRVNHPEAQLPDYEIRSTRSLQELCRFVIRGTIPVPVDVSLCKLPIPKLLQEYLNFPECD